MQSTVVYPICEISRAKVSPSLSILSEMKFISTHHIRRILS